MPSKYFIRFNLVASFIKYFILNATLDGDKNLLLWGSEERCGVESVQNFRNFCLWKQGTPMKKKNRRYLCLIDWNMNIEYKSGTNQLYIFSAHIILRN